MDIVLACFMCFFRLEMAMNRGHVCQGIVLL